MSNMPTGIVPERRSLLVIGHPGHELRLYGWVGRAQPLVCILTDGSGSDGVPRLADTLRILKTLGAEMGPVCGELSDRQIYEKILRHEHSLFDILCERLVKLIREQNIGLVVSDGIEGYNPVHDLCEILVRTAVAIVNNVGKRPHELVQHCTIPLMDDPRPVVERGEATNHALPQRTTAHHTIELTPHQFKRKLKTIRDYAARAGGILQEEVEDAFNTLGENAFAREYLFLAGAPGQEPERSFLQQKPYYEIYGEQRVAASRYQSVIRFREHILPLMDRLGAKVSASAPAEVQG